MSDYKFGGFLSHHRKADGRFAAELQQRLERKYRRLPKSLRQKERALRICRDATDFTPGGPSVEDEVVQKIAQSKKLIVLCSPAARSSDWVGFEVEAYRASHPSTDGAGIVAVLCSGDDPIEATILPPALTSGGAVPLAVDFRAASFPSARDHSLFCRDAGLLQVLAPLLDVEFPELVNRQRQYDLELFRRRAAVAGLVILLLLALSWYANERRLEARDRLSTSLKLAREVHQVIDENLLNLPGSASIRKGLLERTSRMLEELSLSAPDDPGVAFEQLAVDDRHRNWALWREGLRGVDPREMEKQVAVAHRLARGEPENAELQRAEAVTRIHFGESLFDDQEWDLAREQYDRARVLLERILTPLPFDHVWQRDLAIAETRLGELEKARGNLAEARKHYRIADPIAERLRRSSPEAPDTLTLHWMTQCSLGVLAVEMQEHEEAERLLRAALELARSIARVLRPRPEGLEREAQTTLELGKAAGAAGHLEQAVEWLEESVDLWRRVLETDRESRRYAHELERALLELVDVLERADRLTEAGPLLAEAESLNAGLRSKPDATSSELQRCLLLAMRLAKVDTITTRAAARYAACAHAATRLWEARDETGSDAFRKSSGRYEAVARFWIEWGLVAERLGDIGNADALFAKAEEVLQALVEALPEEPLERLMRARVWLLRGRVGRAEDSEELLARAVAESEKLSTALETRTRHLALLIRAEAGFRQASASSDVEVAGPGFQRAEQCFEQLGELVPNTYDAAVLYPEFRSEMASYAMSHGDPEAAEQLYTAAEEIALSVVEANALDPLGQRELARARLGLLGIRGNDVQWCLDTLEETIADLQAVVARDPADAEVRRLLGHGQQYQAHFLVGAGRPRDAVLAAEAARENAQALVDAVPDRRAFNTDLVDAWRVLAEVHLKVGAPQDARRAFGRAHTALSTMLTHGVSAESPAIQEQLLSLYSGEIQAVAVGGSGEDLPDLCAKVGALLEGQTSPPQSDSLAFEWVRFSQRLLRALKALPRPEPLEGLRPALELGLRAVRLARAATPDDRLALYSEVNYRGDLAHLALVRSDRDVAEAMIGEARILLARGDARDWMKADDELQHEQNFARILEQLPEK